MDEREQLTAMRAAVRAAVASADGGGVWTEAWKDRLTEETMLKLRKILGW